MRLQSKTLFLLGVLSTVRVATSCIAVPGYTLATDTDHYGDDISCQPSITLATVSATCSNTADCKAFNTYSVNGVPWACTKRVAAPTQTLVGICFYAKNAPAAASCVDIPGYTALPNSDHWQDDIGQAATPAEAVTLCSADVSCTGFNSNGWYKRVVSPVGELQGVCLYVKAGQCPPVPGYVRMPNSDHFGYHGDDMARASSFPAAVAQCTSNSSCKGFNSAGYCKREVAQAQTTAWSCLYTKECPDVPNFIAFPNTDHWYDDIGCAFSPTDAMSKCAYGSSCAGFNSLGYYKNNTATATTLMGVCLYTKPTSCPQVPGYTITPQVDHWGDDIGRATSLEDAASKCDSDSSCMGFNSKMYYKRVASPTAADATKCFYKKVPSSCQLLWSDEFNTSSLDTASWNFFTGKAWNNELEYYTSRSTNVRVEGGNLVIEAWAESYGGMPYTSGRIDTGHKRAFVPGMAVGGRTFPKIRVESKIMLPKGKGMWPAFWMMPDGDTYGQWPYSGEIDILEAINNMDVAYFTTHFMAGPTQAQQQGYYASSNLALQWHTYAVEWTATQMTFYVDGLAQATLHSSSVDPVNGWRTTSLTANPVGPNSPFDKPFYIILNLAVGGDWPGSPDTTTPFPSWMLVDYVRVTGC